VAGPAEAPIPAGWVGQLRADLVESRGLAGGEAVFGGEIDIDALPAMPHAKSAAIVPLPRHPSIVRDVSIVIDERLPAAEVRGTIRANAPATLAEIREFDRYRGQGVPAGQVSLSVRLTFRDPGRTLTDAEVQHAIERIIGALERDHGAKLRGA
jgi:phenylalanyl-tRNA synthetase beta chain